MARKRTTYSCGVDIVPVQPMVRHQKVVAEFQEDGSLLIMHGDGRIEGAANTAKAWASIMSKARTGNNGVTITTVEWRNVPADFVPPNGGR